MNSPSVSVIVNTYNRAAWLGDALNALQGLRYPNFEVVVVNGPSTDNTAEVIAGWASRIKMLSCDEANLSMSRNIGIAAAAGEVICFMDDDAAPHPCWLDRLIPLYADPEVGGVGGYTVNNTGVSWQVRKTICDRYGNAFNVDPYFDERPLNRPGSPYYPSLLGTNSSFRATALRAIGGFDNSFAYLLDETDVCLRLVDAGWKIVYEPSAIIFHQFAESHIRSPERIARTIYPSARSKAYFVTRHGIAHDPARAGAELDRYREEISTSNKWLEDHGKIESGHRFALDQDLMRGVEEGMALALGRAAASGGNLPEEPALPFVRFPVVDKFSLGIVLVSKGFPPVNETGIARWTWLVAHGLARRGHRVHVLTEASGGIENTCFRDGIWVHELVAKDAEGEPFAEMYDIPLALAAWTARVWQETQYLKTFGLDIASFPIWDLEGIATFDDADLTTLVSLHTTYAMARPFKKEWTERPLYGYHFVDRVIAAERQLLSRAPVLIANSKAIVGEIEAVYDLDLADRAPVVPHGTPDPLITRQEAWMERNRAMLAGAPLQLLFAGRFEARKGFDIALQVAKLLAGRSDIVFRFVGDQLTPDREAWFRQQSFATVFDSPNVHFDGLLERDQLDDAYVCADIVLMPSRFESFGLVAIEAMAAGRPVVGLKSGGLAEILTVENGCSAFDDGPRTAQLIAEGILSLDRERSILAERGRLARRAWDAFYSVDAMISGLEAVYTRALKKGEAPIGELLS